MQVTFLIATERSGSNLITKILDAHPNVCGPSPLHILRVFGMTFYQAGDISHEKTWTDIIEDLNALLQSDFARWKHVFTKTELLQLAEPGDLSTLLRQVFFIEAQAHGKQQVFIKEIELYKYHSFIQWVFPNAKFLYLIRDPRDVSLSWRKSGPHAGGLLSGSSTWIQDQKQSIPLLASWAENGRAILVKYEDLVTQKEKELLRICDFLNIEYTDRMLDFHKDDLTRQNASLNPLWKNLSNTIMENNSNKFEQAMTRVEVAMVERICFAEMQYFGYQLKSEWSILEKITPQHIQSFMQKENTKYPSTMGQPPEHELIRRKRIQQQCLCPYLQHRSSD
ncbi:MAG: hypothetical protein CL916_07630 [Deltaproteobacteria bacterium]|nr:hypothetical protein [Deltaproteobacteria bacterium]